MLARRARSPHVRRGGFPLSDDGPTAPLLEYDIAALEGQRSIARDESGDRPPGRLSPPTVRETSVLVSSDERLDVGAGCEQGGIELSVPSDLVHPRSHQGHGRTDVASVVSALLWARRPPVVAPTSATAAEFFPDRASGDTLVDACEPSRAPRATRVLTAQPKRRRCRTKRTEPVGRSRRPVVRATPRSSERSTGPIP